MNNLRTDMYIDFDNNYNLIKKRNNIEILESKKNNNIYHTIKFNTIENKYIKNTFLKELKYFISLYNINIKHVLIVGLGNIDNTSDSIGPLTTKYIKTNFITTSFSTIFKTKISTLIPNVLANTGINTDLIIKSITDKIKPDLVILIDSFITNNINHINKTIELSTTGIKPGTSLLNNNKKIDKNLLKKPVLTIGIPVSLEYIYNNNTMLLSTSNIDYYVKKVSKIISTSINELFNL